MKSIIIYPKNEKQKHLLQSLLEEMKVRYVFGNTEKEGKMTKEDFLKKIDTSIEQANSGNTVKISKEDQKQLLGL
ncbi:MAG: DUF2683 family protein [Flavobacterium sp.]|jgi:adenine-specific DNA methylase